MKRFLVILLLIVFINNCRAATIYWDNEGGDGLWATASNWVGNVVPGASDDVVLDNSVFLTSYSVTLPTGTVTVSVNTLTITPAAGVFITLSLPNGNDANPGFTATGPGDALVLNNRAAFFNSSGASSGTGVEMTLTNFFRINDGGRYIHNTARGHAAIVDRLSTVSGTELGEFEFDVPLGSYTLSLSGSTYGSLTLLAVANGGAVTYLGSGGSDCNVRGNFRINMGVTFNISMTSSGNFIVQQDYTQIASSTFNLQSSTFNNTVKIAGNLSIGGTMTESNSGLPTLELNGTSIQSITVTTGSILNDITFKMNNSAGAILGSALSLPYNLTLASGNIDIGANNLTVAGIMTGGGTSSFVQTSGAGYLLHPAVTTMTFPIGNSSYNPVTITNGNSADYYARVETGINPGITLPTYGINRTWNIYASVPTPNVTVTFQYAGADANPGATQPQNMEVLLYAGAWSIIAGNTSIFPGGADPYTITTSTVLTINNSSVPYALGKSGGWTLPVDCIISTRAQKRNNEGIISWTVNSCAGVNSFEVQRSVNNSEFRSIGTIDPASNITDFNFIDANLSTGANLYRIKVNRLSGTAKYSNTVAVLHNSIVILITSLAPNPVHNSAVITLSTARQNLVDFKVFDLSGRVVKQWQSNVAEGSNTISINVEGLSAGVYHVLASSAGAKAISKFIKQ